MFSSALIIYMIRRSSTKLSTIYHRMMLGMSTADILGSSAMALSTLPMPTEYYPHSFAGTILGNDATCAAQAFFVTWGGTSMFAYNVALVMYYAAVIAFQMKEKDIKRKLEPTLHILAAVVFGILPSTVFLFLGFYGRSGWEAWCSVHFKNGSIIINTMFAITFSVLFGIIITCFVLIIRKVYIQERILNATTTTFREREIKRRSVRVTAREEQLQTSRNAHENSKAITIQAFGYLSALLCTLSMPLLRIVIGGESSDWTHRGQVVLIPLQGMFNFVIFTCHKIYNYRRVHPDARRLDVLKKLLYGPDKIDDEVLFSRISMISIANDGDDDEDNNGRIERIHVTNERNEEEVLDFNDDVDNQNDAVIEEEQHYDKIEDGISYDLSGAVSSISPSPKEEGSSGIPDEKEKETRKIEPSRRQKLSFESNSVRLTSSLVSQLANNNVQSNRPRNDALSNVRSSLGSVGLSYAPSSSRNEQSLSHHTNSDSLDAFGVSSGAPSMDEGEVTEPSRRQKLTFEQSNSVRLTSSLVSQLANNNVQSNRPRNDAFSNVGSSLGSVGLSYAPPSSRNEQSLSHHTNNDSLDAFGVSSGAPSIDVGEGTLSDESLDEKRKNVSLLDRFRGFSWLQDGR